MSDHFTQLAQLVFFLSVFLSFHARPKETSWKEWKDAGGIKKLNTKSSQRCCFTFKSLKKDLLKELLPKQSHCETMYIKS